MAGLYAMNGVVFLAVLLVWALVAPGARVTIGIAFLAGQIYLVARLALKLQFLASQTALFQSSLAHAGYAAAPVAEWPESPSAELIARGSSASS